MIKFRTGVKIRSGIKIRHSENPLVIWLTSNPDLIHIQYNGAGSSKITYTEASAKTLNELIFEVPSYNSREYTVPFTPANEGAYHYVNTKVWNALQQPIASNYLIYQLRQSGQEGELPE